MESDTTVLEDSTCFSIENGRLFLTDQIDTNSGDPAHNRFQQKPIERRGFLSKRRMYGGAKRQNQESNPLFRRIGIQCVFGKPA